MVDSPPPIVLACLFCKHIAFDGDQSRLGGEGVAQGRPSRSHLCGKEIMFFLYLGARNDVGIQPFPASNMKCRHLLNQLQGQPPICGTKKCPINSILMSIRIIYQFPLVQMSVILIKFHQIPLISCTSH